MTDNRKLPIIAGVEITTDEEGRFNLNALHKAAIAEGVGKDMHGVAGAGYANCTNAIYNELFDKDAKGLRIQRNIPKMANVRNSMDSDELVAVMFAETLSKGRIAEEQASGNVECQQATSRSSRHVRLAIDADRSDRQMRLA